MVVWELSLLGIIATRPFSNVEDLEVPCTHSIVSPIKSSSVTVYCVNVWHIYRVAHCVRISFQVLKHLHCSIEGYRGSRMMARLRAWKSNHQD